MSSVMVVTATPPKIVVLSGCAVSSDDVSVPSSAAPGGISPSWTSNVLVCPSRLTSMCALVPGAIEPIIKRSARGSFTFFPFTAVITSPVLIPAFAAGAFGSTSPTSAPVGCPLSFIASAISGVRGWAEVRARPATFVTQALHHLTREICGNSEADPLVSAAAAEDRRVNAEQPTLDINECATGVAHVNSCVGLDKILVINNTHAAAADRADDPHRDCLP